LDNSRFLIAILIVLGMLFLYQELLQWRYPQQYASKSKSGDLLSRGETKPAKSVSPTSPAAQPAAGSEPSVAEAQRPEQTGSPALKRSPPEGVVAGSVRKASQRTIRIDTSFYRAMLTSRGARMVSLKLKKYRETDQPDSPSYEMIRTGDRLPMGFVVTTDGVTTDDAEVDYATVSPANVEVSPGALSRVEFVGKSKSGLTLKKVFTFRDSSYVFEITGEVTGSSRPPEATGLTISQPLRALPGYRDYPTLQADVNGKAVSESEQALEKGLQPLSGPIAWAGFGDRYFLAAFIPQSPRNGRLMMDYVGNEADARMLFDGTARVASRVYVGPKQLDILEAADPSLSKAIDLGFWGIIALPFLRLLKLFHHFVPNYGIAIILLTVLVRLVTLPMSIRGQRSMMKMQRLQPQVERIREKLKGDSERLNREMVDLYKRNHVNPLGGCLPMVIQFPVFIGLYEALLNAVELRHAPFIAWIRDLSAPDCLPIPGMPAIPFTDLHGIPVLVLLMTVTAFVQQWISPRNPDPNQQKMMMYMPLVFSLIFIEFPAGLSLYYFSSNLLGVVQQFILNREFKQYSPVATA